MDEKLRYARAALRKAQQDAWEKGQARLSAKQLAHVRSPKERSEDEPALEVPSSEQVWQAPPGIARGGTGPRPSRRDPKKVSVCLLYTSPSPRDGLLSRMPSSA